MSYRRCRSSLGTASTSLFKPRRDTNENDKLVSVTPRFLLKDCCTKKWVGWVEVMKIAHSFNFGYYRALPHNDSK